MCRYSERRIDKNRSGYSTDAGPARPKARGSGYQSDGPASRNRHRQPRQEKQAEPAKRAPQPEEQEQDMELLLDQVHEIEQLVTHKMQWRGAVAVS